eukprot:GILJ01005848.1.p1 GENE.GILJ01005848.1~~GILJ01005848.1.p1  ORF type:complete len:180 (+),score=23.07 GILJ01005848.1:84-623(+)
MAAARASCLVAAAKNDDVFLLQLASALEAACVSGVHEQVASISLHSYAVRLGQYMGCTREVFILAAVYIERLIACNPEFMLTSANVHRVLLAAVVVAAKFHDDQFFNNAFYAKVGGVTLKELNGLETELLTYLGWTLVVHPAIFERVERTMQNYSIHPHRSPMNFFVAPQGTRPMRSVV